MNQGTSLRSTEDDLPFYDVVVVGAGLSGLTAAFRLLQLKPNLSIHIFEAKDRIGGRLFSIDLPASNSTFDTWDLGGSWIGNKYIQPFINQLLSELNIKTYPQTFSGKKIVQTGYRNKITAYDSTIPDIGILSLWDASSLLKSLELLQKKITTPDSLSDPFLLKYDSMTAETLFKKKIWTRCTLDCIRSGLRASFGSELNKLSALYLFAFANSCGGFYSILESGEETARGYKVVGGATKILHAILDILGPDVLELETIITSVKKDETHSIVETSTGKRYKANQVIMAIPPHLIPNIIFSPPLNPTKIEYFSSVTPGHLIKVLFTYEERFWVSEGFSGEIITNGGDSHTAGCSVGPLCIVFDATTDKQSPALVGFIGGEQALQYENKTISERKEAVLNSLEMMFNKKKVRDFIAYSEKIWRHESFVGGCPVSIVPPGVARHLNQSLRDPENNIYFAGSELANNWMGYMEGAVESGEKAALQVLSEY